MKFLLIAFISLLFAKMALAQNANNLHGEPVYTIILKGVNLNGSVSMSKYATVISNSYNDTLSVSSLTDHCYFKVKSFDITIFHKGKDGETFHSQDGILKGAFYKELRFCHPGDVVYFDNVYIIKNGSPIKAAKTAFKLQ